MVDNYKKDIEELKNLYHTDEVEGLTDVQIQELRKEYGSNSFEKQKKELFVK